MTSFIIFHSFCLQALLTDETISNVPVLILGNKIDRPEAISEDGLRGMFGLHGQTTGKVMNMMIIKLFKRMIMSVKFILYLYTTENSRIFILFSLLLLYDLNK